MFCTKCGEKNSDDAVFCTSCGEKLKKQKYIAKKQRKEKVYILKKIVLGAIIFVSFFGLIYGVWANTGVNGTINKLEKSLKRCNMEMYYEVIYPKRYIEDMIDEYYNGSKAEYKEAMEEKSEEVEEEYDKEDVEIVSLKKIGGLQDLEPSDISRMKSRIDPFELHEGIFSEVDIIKEIEYQRKTSVQEVKKCRVKIEAKVGDNTEYDRADFIFFKTDGKWYIYDFGEIDFI